ncbi:MAG TPA: ribosome maturation factor RimP [Alphaproteobacteria bacterium]|nr:ribosome maturation factor RimP [Alphaproteobacteria bacterium]
MSTPIDVTINQMALEACEALGLSLVQARLGGDSRNLTLKVLVERPDGSSPTLEECTKVSRTMGTQLDVAETIKSRYHLEVGTPGLDRPLVKPADFKRFVGRQTKLQFSSKQLIGNGAQASEYLPGVTGVLTGATDTDIEMAIKHPTCTIRVKYADLRYAHLVPSDAELAMVMKGERLPGQVGTVEHHS